jgi:hypothetical protein
LVIENATFYSVEDNFLNCSTGPIGPLLPARNQYQKFPPLFHKSVHNSNNEHLTNTEKDLKTTANSGWRESTLIPSKNLMQNDQWKQVTTRRVSAEDLISASRDLRQDLNRRCSGMTNGRICSFNLHLDHEQSQLWGSGLVDIFYRCIPKRMIETTCSSVQSSQSDSFSSYSRSSFKVDFLDRTEDFRIY